MPYGIFRKAFLLLLNRGVFYIFVNGFCGKLACTHIPGPFFHSFMRGTCNADRRADHLEFLRCDQPAAFYRYCFAFFLLRGHGACHEFGGDGGGHEHFPL